MSMQALNQLVARSIIDPMIVQAFSTGRIGEILEDLDFSADIRTKLTSIKTETWTEFAVMAYRFVKASEPAFVRIELPSPAEGLMPEERRISKEQVA
jgi:hypothetical protein